MPVFVLNLQIATYIWFEPRNISLLWSGFLEFPAAAIAELEIVLVNNVCKVLLIMVRKAFEGHLTAVGIGWDDSSQLPGASKISVYTRFQNLKTWVFFPTQNPRNRTFWK